MSLLFQIINLLYEEAIKLKTKSDSATDLIRDEQIRRYITNYLTPLVTQCAAYGSNTRQALNTGHSALQTAVDAREMAVKTSSKVLILAANIDKLQTISNPALDTLNQSIIRVRSLYASTNLNTSLEKLRRALIQQKADVNRFKEKNKSLKAIIQNYKLLHESLASLSC